MTCLLVLSVTSGAQDTGTSPDWFQDSRGSIQSSSTAGLDSPGAGLDSTWTSLDSPGATDSTQGPEQVGSAGKSHDTSMLHYGCLSIQGLHPSKEAYSV